jgi:hypothetical protein
MSLMLSGILPLILFFQFHFISLRCLSISCQLTALFLVCLDVLLSFMFSFNNSIKSHILYNL